MYRGRGLTVHIEVRGRELDDEVHITPHVAFFLAWASAAAAGAVYLSIPIGFILTSVGFTVSGVILLVRNRHADDIETSLSDEHPTRSGDDR